MGPALPVGLFIFTYLLIYGLIQRIFLDRVSCFDFWQIILILLALVT